MKRTTVSFGEFLLQYGFYLALLFLIIGFSFGAPNFLTADNFLNMLHTLAPTLIMISGLVFVILIGAIDFSVGSIAFLAASIGTYLMVYLDVPPWLAVIVIVICGGLIGAFNGLIIEVFKVNPLITTFGTMLAFRGLGYLIAGAKYTPIPESLVSIHDLRVGPVYLDIIISIGLVLLLYFVQRRTIFGKQLMALGNGRETAEKLSINVRWISFLAFIISGLFAGLGSIFNMAQGSFLSPRMGQGLEFTGIAIVVIGGISLFGGEGSITGLLLGVFTVYIIENGLQHMGLSPYLYPLLRGAIIFIAMYADSLKTRLRARKLIREET
jgi:ribose/xylose/arabinose/galactoside ABC-type transport system permease subunit